MENIGHTKDGNLDSPKSFIVRSLVVCASVIIILAGMKAAQGIVAPFCLAIFFAVVLFSPLRWLQSKGFTQISSFLVVSLTVVICGYLLSWMFIQSINQFVKKTPEYRQKLDATFGQIDVFLNKHGFYLFESVFQQDSTQEFTLDAQFQEYGERIQGADEEEMPEPSVTIAKVPAEQTGESEPVPGVNKEFGSDHKVFQELMTMDGELDSLPPLPPLDESLSTVSIFRYVQWFYVQWIAAALGQTLSFVFIVLLMVVFMVLEASRMPQKLVQVFGSQGITNERLQHISEKICQYMVIKTIISIFVGLSTTVFLWMMGVEYAILWGLCAFFLNYIPNIGSIIASLPPIALAFFDYGIICCLIVTAGLILINWVIGYYLEPKMLGDGLGISPLIVLLSLIFWGWLFGPIGMFLSAPLTIVVKIILDSFEETRWVSVLMDD